MAALVRRGGAQRVCSQQWRARSKAQLFVHNLTEVAGQPRDVGLPLFGEGEHSKTRVGKKDLGAVIPRNMGQFYQRALPPAQLAFSSDEGRKRFKEALVDGTMENYFYLAEQFRTQDEPTFCGLTTLAMVLNSLRIDPMQTWKGAWRWISEDMLSCCSLGSHERVREEGISFDVFKNLALCQGASIQAHRAPPAPTSLESAEFEVQFRAAVERVCRSKERESLIICYSRSALGQTGEAGHFSPIGGYHAGSDSVLILDVARFKYPPHWVPVTEIAEAMTKIDKSTGRTRGFMLMQLPETYAASHDPESSGLPLTVHWLPPAAGRKLSESLVDALYSQCSGHPDEPVTMTSMRRWLHAASMAEPQVLRKLLQVGETSALSEVLDRLESDPLYKELCSAYRTLVASGGGFEDVFPPLRSDAPVDLPGGNEDNLGLAQHGELWVLLLLLLPRHLRVAVSPQLAALPVQKNIAAAVRGPWALPLEVLRETLAHLIPPLHADACSTVLD